MSLDILLRQFIYPFLYLFAGHDNHLSSPVKIRSVDNSFRYLCSGFAPHRSYTFEYVPGQSGKRQYGKREEDKGCD